MNFMKKVFSLVLVSACSFAQGFTPFAIHKPYHSIEATQTLIEGIERNDKTMIIPALRALPTIEAIGITVMGDTPLMYAVRRYLKSLMEREKNAVLDQVLKGQDEQKALQEQQQIATEKQFHNLAQTLLKGSLVGLLLYHKNRRTILAKSMIISVLAGTGSALSTWPNINKKVHHHLIAAAIGFAVTLFVETVTQDESPEKPQITIQKLPTKNSSEHQEEIIQLLLQASQDVTIRNNEGINVVDLVVAYKQSVLQNSPEVDSLLTYIMTKYPKHALLEHPLDDIMEQFMNHTRR